MTPSLSPGSERAAETAFLDGRVILHAGDCLEVLAGLPEASVDSVVCDPPYHLTSIVKRFGVENAAACKVGKTGAYARASAGFMGKQWDGGDIAFRVETWEAVLRALKPGGHLLAFSGTRTYHRMVCAIEDAGFEIRDQIGWCFGSGFPKSHDVSKGIDKAAGVEREAISQIVRQRGGSDDSSQSGGRNYRLYGGLQDITAPATAPATDSAKQWQGWGTALKPAWEPIVLARKPLIGTVAENVLRYGTGAINIDGCRIHADDARGGEYVVRRLKPGATLNATGGNWRPEEGGRDYHGHLKPGRFPANIVHDGSPEVLAAFPDSDGQLADASSSSSRKTQNVYGAMKRGNGREGEPSAERRYTEDGATNFSALPGERRGDSGSAARFFYTAKADAEDRLGSKHPTVKPLDLIQWLCRLVTPPGGTVLDCFAGTGTTGEAAWREGMRAILVEREVEYCQDIARRMELAVNPTKRAAVAKTKNNLDRPEDLPLFAKPEVVPE